MSGHELFLVTIHTKINEMCFVLPCSSIDVVQLIDSLDPGLLVESIQMSTLVCGVNNDPQASSIPCSIYIILIGHYTEDTLFTPCNTMHPATKNCCLNNSVVEYVHVFVHCSYPLYRL